MSNGLMTIVTFVIMIAFFYVIIVIPENKRKKKYNAMLESLKVNDEVMTRGGIIGSIVVIKDDYVIIQSGPDKSRLKMSKSAIGSILNSKDEAEVKEVKESK
ncbi:preprotein translocase subunit YajC [Haloimpatiens lingqiaonensis]|uniref:preprotein translocase subunit YajC n=1 Tax=Haloimpatiens lingqiaonensis TaxID=1380675 RepID=UPI0010FE4EF5|nr:preprotein translocase subunit YajC [Haloimpatiens lingqiaonensis]